MRHNARVLSGEPITPQEIESSRATDRRLSREHGNIDDLLLVTPEPAQGGEGGTEDDDFDQLL